MKRAVRLYEADELASSPWHSFEQEVLALHPNHADTQTFLARATERVRSASRGSHTNALTSSRELGRFPEALELYRETTQLFFRTRERSITKKPPIVSRSWRSGDLSRMKHAEYEQAITERLVESAYVEAPLSRSSS